MNCGTGLCSFSKEMIRELSIVKLFRILVSGFWFLVLVSIESAILNVETMEYLNLVAEKL